MLTHTSDSKIRPATGRKSAVPQCFQPARFSFLNWLEFCLVEKRIAAPGRPPPAPLEARQPRSKPWRRRLPPLPGRPERRRRAAQATTSAPPTGGAAAAAPTAPPSAVARRLSSGRRQVPRAEGATGPADARPAEPSSSTAGRAPPRRFSAHWRAEEAAGVAAGIGGGASSVLGSEADFERRSIDLRADRWVALGGRPRHPSASPQLRDGDSIVVAGARLPL